MARSGVCRLGTAELTFLEPTVFIVEAPARGERQSIILEGGALRVATRPGGRGVLLRTEKGTLRDIGTVFKVRLNHPLEEQEMIARIRANALPVFVAATVLSGSVAWESPAGETTVIGPESGTVNLAYDPSLGTVAEREGLVYVRPAGGERWTLADDGTSVVTGDWVKTAARGANAAEIRLKDGARLTIGPGGLAEVASLSTVRLHSGELEVRPIDGVPIRVEGPGDAVRQVAKAAVLRAAADALVVLDTEPRWLAGYRAKASTEAMGSLLAQIDGRDVPLTIGYHKVTVDLRDQIARTVIEQSFVNHTAATLEGVFYFPLPQDASISGFAMWIGNELVEADIVEKERAREIYEEILREKRDPGLLEWTGGNIFKARVYPIFGHSEKRIRITYTEVLAKEGNAYRYFYALRSEMLRLHPLRRLEVKVTVSSAQPIASVACPSHMARIRKTEHAAQIEFSAEEYSPSRDFEVRVATAPAAGNIVLVPHRRGDDGYFMILLSAEGGAAGRGLLADGAPLDLIIIADTSGSMTAEQLRSQRAFIASLLESLGPKDRFNLLAFDVEAVWAFPDRVPVEAATREQALAFIEQRGALGWTDLELALGEAMARAREATQVVYVGDGIVTKGDADPAAFARGLKRMYRGRGSFHAVGVGSTYDLTALRAIASLGQGSLHRGGSGRDEAQMAAALLAEIAAPGLRDIELAWDGVRVARVYPEILPNLPRGREQFILGRYLVEDREQKGTLRVRGMLDGKSVSYELPIAFPRADEGNAFIPRFWARMHLDHLLAQGRDPAIVDRIIALSEDYQIITPYTSFLVLESDADRERFQVRKRFRMRGGEEFFAEGREAAGYELARQQMLAARLWRRNLRVQYLQLYDGLGRHIATVPEQERYPWLYGAPGMAGSGPMRSYRFAGTRSAEGVVSSGIVSSEDFYFSDESAVLDAKLGEMAWADANGVFDAPVSFGLHDRADSLSLDYRPSALADDFAMDALDSISNLAAARSRVRSEPVVMDGDAFYGYLGRSAVAAPVAGESLFRRYERGVRRSLRPWPTFTGLFPTPGGVRPVFEGKWPEDIRRVTEPCNRRAVLSEMQGGLRVAIETEAIDTRDRVRPAGRARYLIAAASWAAIRSGAPGDIPHLEWLGEGQRGALDLGRLLGSRRKAEARDAISYPSPFERYFDWIEAAHGASIPSLSRDGDIAIITLVPRTGRGAEIRIRIDTRTNAVVETATSTEGKPTEIVTFGEFTAIAGAAFPQRIERRDGDGRMRSVTRVSYEELDATAFAGAMAQALDPAADAIVLSLPLPKLGDAKTRAHEGRAVLEDRWVLANHFAATQRWDEVKAHAAAVEALAAGRPGLAWIRLEVLLVSRRNEEARHLAQAMGQTLAGTPREGDVGLASVLYQKASQASQHIERLALLEILEPVFARLDARLEGMKTYGRHRLACLDGLNRREEAFALREQLAGAYPDDAALRVEYANALAARGEIDAAVAHLDGAVAADGPWSDGEIATLRERAGGILYEHRRQRAFLAHARRWLATDPKRVSAQSFSRMISALVMLDREVEADDLIETWLAGAQGDDPAAVALARFEAALGHALGDGADLYANRIDAKWRPVLASVARALARSERRGPAAGRILQHHKFRRCDEIVPLLRGLYREMAADVETLAPAVLENLLAWTEGYATVEGDVTREEIIARVLARWEREEDPQAKEILGRVVVQRGSRDLALVLRRRQLAEAAAGDERARATADLLNLLLGGAWMQEAEDEIIALLPGIGSGDGKDAAQAGAVARIADWFVRTHAAKRIEGIPDRDKMTRRQLAPHEAEARRKALEDAAASLGRIEAVGLSEELLAFIRIERITVEAQRGIEPARLAEELRAILAAIPEPPAEEDDDDADARRMALDPHRTTLAERCILVLGNLATREGADAALADDLVALLRDLDAKKARRVDARTHLYRLLVVLDRAADVEAALAGWAEEGGAIQGNAWRMPYAYVLAEQGKIAAAVEVFEGIAKSDELGPAEYRMLAGLHMALDDRAKNREARIRAYEVTDEWRIRSSLVADHNRFRRRGGDVPEELDEEVLLRVAAILRKSSQPQNHIWLVRQLYEATKDFRLLEALPEAVIGQTAAKIYPYLESLGQVIGLIGDEATADRLEKHLVDLRGKAGTDIDRRALFLLEFLAERRAADQASGAGPHVQAALGALEAAFKGEWADGEPVLMARYLASVGGLVPPLRAVQLRQLRSLHDGTEPRSHARFVIGTARARALWANAVREEALRVLEASIGEWREAHGGLLPPDDLDALSTWASYLGDMGEFAAGEALWRSEIERPYNEAQKRGLAVRLYGFLVRALGAGSRATAWRSADLYRAARDEMRNALQAMADEGHAQAVVGTLCSLFRQANEMKIDGVAGDLADFAYRDVPAVLRLYQYRQGQDIVGNVAGCIRDIAGPRDAVAFLVARAEAEPSWLWRRNEDVWAAHSWRLGRWRREATDIGAMAPRLLTVVVQEVRRDLADRSSRNRSMYWRNHGDFWEEKAGDFLRAAQEVLATRQDSLEGVKYIAAYMADGLHRYGEAIDALLAFHRRHGLDEGGQSSLVAYLQRSERFEESIPLAAAMVASWPGNVEYRVFILRAYGKAGKSDALSVALSAADVYFREGGRWGENPARRLGWVCLDIGRFEEAAAYYGDAINFRTRSRRDRGAGDGTLSSYYGDQARAYAGLGKTKDAVDAAAGAIVSWGSDLSHRRRATESLLAVLREARDLDAYVEAFEGEVAETRLENPTIRKALGRVFLDRKEYAKAARHLDAAVEGGPADAETARLLIEAYQEGGSPVKAAERLRVLARQASHDFALWKELGERYAKLERPGEAERAYTTLAEMSANESEGRAILAEIRAAQGRFADAAAQWRHVIRIRSREPAGYLGLAEALIGAGDNAQAREVLDDILRKDWHPRFEDVGAQARKLIDRLPRS